MIIQICGTNGSGKTTVVRQVLNMAGDHLADHIVGRQAPIGYVVKFPRLDKPLYIPGAYEHVGTAGCDSIKRYGVEFLYDQLIDRAKQYHLLYEGAFVMNHTRGPELVRRLSQHPFYVLLLTTPLETCFQSIAKRREETEFASPAAQRRNIAGNHVRAQNYANKMRVAGAYVSRVTRAGAVDTVLDILERGKCVSGL